MKKLNLEDLTPDQINKSIEYLSSQLADISIDLNVGMLDEKLTKKSIMDSLYQEALREGIKK